MWNINKLTWIPVGTYIDLKVIPPNVIKDFISSLTSKDIDAYRSRIHAARMQIFSRVSVNSYNQFLKGVYEKIRLLQNKE